MTFINKRYFLTFLAVAAAVSWALWALALRFTAERRSDSVETAFSWREAESLCAADDYPPDDFLDRLKAAGISSVILDEETPASLNDSGEAVFISRRDYERFRLLDILTAGSVIRADTLIFGSAAAASHYSAALAKRHSLPTETRTFGARRFVYIKPGRSAKSVDSLPLGPSFAKMQAAARYGFAIVPSLASSGDLSFLFDAPYGGVSLLVFENPAGVKPEAATALRFAARFRAAYFEFQPASLPTFFGPESVIRSHRLHQQEKIKMSRQEEAARYMRAARERGVRFFKITLDDARSVDANLDVVKTFSRRLKKSGYKIGPASSASAASFGGHSAGIFRAPYAAVRKSVAFVLALLFPAVLARLARGYPARFGAAGSFAVFNVSLIASALFTAAFVSSADFLSGISAPAGVKFLLVFPWLAVAPAIFEPQEAGRFFGAGVRVYHLLAAAAAASALAVILWRSGNDGSAAAAEMRLRGALERIFVVRPRWKEILVGQPLLYIAFRRRNRICLFAGSLASVSVINTFLHTHTPLSVSLWRTLSGVLAGGLIGAAADYALAALGVKIPADLKPRPEKT